MSIANHCIRNLEWDEKLKDWYASLIRVVDAECIVMGDLAYILQYVNDNDDVKIIETGSFP